MALTFWKWSAATAATCGLTWFWLLHDHKPEETVKPFVTATSGGGAASSPAVSGEMNRTTERLRLLQLRDSIVRISPNPAEQFAVRIDPAYGPALSRAIETKLRERWSRTERGAKMPVVIAAVVDSATTVSGFPRRKPGGLLLPITTFLPSAATGSRCVSIVRIPVAVNERTPKFIATNVISSETIDGLLGPCAFYATFGAPGAKVEAWLRDGAWSLAHHADWSNSAPQWDAERSHVGPGLPFLEGFAMGGQAWRVRQVLRTRGIACLGGAEGECTRAAIDGADFSGDSLWHANVVSSTGTNQLAFYMPTPPTNLGPYDGWVLSEMARSMGSDRFAKFWQSQESVPEAFKAASSRDLDGWIRDWGTQIYGPIEVGPGLPLSSIIAGLLTLGLAVFVATSIARRRRVA